jgi:hypothetical protein
VSVHWPGKSWVVLCADGEQSERMTRADAEREALECDGLPDCGGPHLIALVDKHGRVIGAPQRPGRRHP